MRKIILLIDFSEGYGKDLLRGISRYSKEHGPWIFCRMPISNRETLGLQGILKWAKEWGAHGIIGQLYNNTNIRMFTDAGISVIAQDFKERFTGIPNITGDYYETGKLGAEYFLKKGFRNFAFYGFKNIVWSRERSEGFENTVVHNGYKVHYFEHKKSRSRELWYYKQSTLNQWLKSLPKPVAIMTCDDNQGQHITEACRLSGIRIPEEVAVLGVDNDELICNLSDPPLSSVSLNTENGGYETARLMDLLISKNTEKYEDIIIKPVRIISRQSTDIYAANDIYITKVLKYIHTNINKDLNVNHVVEQAPLSRRTLEIRFRQITGLPVYKYIFNLRIEKIAQNLIDTDKSICEIAFDVGLNDCKNISRQFKKIKGCTPNEYRKKHRVTVTKSEELS